MNGVRLGVLSVQGDVEENLAALSRALKMPKGREDDSVLPVRTPDAVMGLDGLVIPGGESTTVGGLSLANGTFDAVKSKVESGMPVLGICAGMIMLSKTADDRVVGRTGQPLLGVLDARIERNSFGRQRSSFEARVEMRPLAITDFRGVFIRAPSVLEVGPGVEVVSRLGGGNTGGNVDASAEGGEEEGGGEDGRIVAVRSGNVLGTAFHPELAGDLAVHKYFVDVVRRYVR